MLVNVQPIEKIVQGSGSHLSVHSIFHTIQGEGPLTGHPAIFIRLAGCNLQCPQCDTVYTGYKVENKSVEQICADVRALHQGPRLVVITGGEPFRQNITPLCYALLDEDYMVQIETNGTLPPPMGFPAVRGYYEEGSGAWIVVSPKAGKVNPRTAELAVAWKYVLNHDSIDPDDGLPILALGHSAAPRIARPPHGFPREAIYVQPADFPAEIQFDRQLENEKNVQAVVRTCMKHGYTVQLQIHKILNLE
jgi:7-carboxy-7-deazaguanine synthase